jgi:ABC-type uncharacterized transport system substrate-binding protein
MTKKIILLALCSLLLALCSAAEAQQPKKVPRIGYLANDPQSSTGEAFRQGLRDLGYIEGQNIIIEWRFNEGKRERIPELVADLVRLKPDVIVATTLTDLRRATTTIPIVMANYSGDPVADGIVTSLARPGGNITGLIPLTPELSGKRLELLKETLPKLSRLAVMYSGARSQWQETETAAKVLGVKLLSLEVHTAADLDKVFEGATQGHVEALLLLRDPVTFVLRKRIVTLAEKARLPGMYPSSEWVEAGGIMSYGPNNIAAFRRTATFVDKILKGVKPADLPIEQPTKFEFLVNLKAAKQIGLTIPPNVLVRADKVIK